MNTRLFLVRICLAVGGGFLSSLEHASRTSKGWDSVAGYLPDLIFLYFLGSLVSSVLGLVSGVVCCYAVKLVIQGSVGEIVAHALREIC